MKVLYLDFNHRPMRVLLLFLGLLGFVNLPAQLEYAGGPFGASILRMAHGDSATYVTTLRGVYRTKDQGENWHKLIDIPVNSNLYADLIYGFSIDYPLAARDSQVLVWYADKWSRLLYSEDFGETWKEPYLPIHNGEVVYGELAIDDSRIYVYNDSLIGYSTNKMKWKVKVLPPGTEGIAFDQGMWYAWSKDSVYRCKQFPDWWISSPIGIPGFLPKSLRVMGGTLYARSGNPHPEPFSFWVAPCAGCPFEKKPEFAGIRAFDVAVVGDSVFLWPQLWPGQCLWVADAVSGVFVKDTLRKTPVKSPADNIHDVGIQTDGHALYLTRSNRSTYSSKDEIVNATALWRTDDHGFTWAVKEFGIDEPMVNGTLIDSTGVYVCTGYGLFFQPVGSEIWKVLGPEEWNTVSVSRFEGKLWRASGSGFYDIHVYWSDDEGVTWHLDLKSESGVLTAGSGALFLKEEWGTVYRKKVDESEWVDITASLPTSNLWFQFVNVPGSLWYYLGETVYRSFDSGDTWELLPKPSKLYNNRSLIHVENDRVYFVGEYGWTSDSSKFMFYQWDAIQDNWGFLAQPLFVPHTTDDNIQYRKISGLVIQDHRWILGLRGRGIYTSQDNGETWTILEPGDVCKSTHSMGVVNGWFFNVSQLFGAWRMELQTTACCAESDELIVQVTPNPTTGHVRIIGQEIVHCIVYDAFGRVVLDKAILNGALELSGLLSGTYFIQLMDHRGRSVVRPIVKL